MKTNVKNRERPITHGGGPAAPYALTPEAQLRRSVLAHLLWEDSFYEDGASAAQRVIEYASKVDSDTLAKLAMEARNRYHLRHVPMLLLLELIRRGGTGVADTIEAVIQRADEMGELVNLYFDGKRKPIPKQMKVGLARAFGKFDEYQLAKYDRDGAVRLRDVMFLVHPKPRDEAQEALFKRVADRALVTPDTWEVGLSGGADKRETFERLLREEKLGYLALLRNLRNMAQSGVDEGLVRDAIIARKGAHRVLPFRYLAAARAVPQFEPWLDQALCESIEQGPRLEGKTAILVDVSGSMDAALSGKSDMSRMDAAATLASVIHGDLRIFSFSHEVKEVPPRRGMAGVDAIIKSQRHGMTHLAEAVEFVNKTVAHDRLIVITDEQSTSNRRVPLPMVKRAYMVNVASYQNGVAYGPWTSITGFSEQVIRFIRETETSVDR